LIQDALVFSIKIECEMTKAFALLSHDFVKTWVSIKLLGMYVFLQAQAGVR